MVLTRVYCVLGITYQPQPQQKPHVHCHHLNQSSQIFRPNLAPAIQQENECSHLAACNTSERHRNSTNHATHETMTEIYAEQQEESWLQQQCGGHKMLDLVNNIQPPIADHSHQDAEEASMSWLFLLSSHDTVQTVFIAEHVQCQEGIFEDNHARYSAANDTELVMYVYNEVVTQTLVTEERHMFRVTSDADLNEITAGGSVTLQEESPC